MPFPVTCPACGKSFSISDEVYEQKIKGRVVSVKCKQCQGAIRVDGTKGSSSARPDATAAAPAAPAPAPAPEAAPQQPKTPAQAPAEAPARAAEAVAAEPAAAVPPAPVPPAVAVDPRSPAAPKLPDPGPAPTPAAPDPAAPAAVRAGLHSSLKQGSNKATLPMGFGAGSKARTPLGAGTAARSTGLGSPKPPEAKPPEPKGPERKAPEPKAPEPKAPEPKAPEPVAALPPQETAPLFAVDSGEGGDRELTAEQIGKEITAGTITGETLVWRDGMAEWLEVKSVPELASYLKKPDAPKGGLPKPATPSPAATTGASAGRFRPRQPTLPMGAIPGPAVSLQKGELNRASPTEVRAKLGESRTGSAKTSAAEAPPRSQQTPEAPPAFDVRAPMLTPVPADDEPTVLRSPDAVAALMSAAEADDSTPVPPRLAAQVGAHRGSAPGLPPLPARPRSPLGSTPDAGVGGGRSPLGDRATPPPPLPFSTQPSSERRPPSAKVTPIDTFRESPEAKRAWFPEPVPAPPPNQSAALPRSSSGGSPPPMPVQAAPPPIPAPQAAPPALPFDDSRVPAATGFSAPAPSTPSAPNPLFAAAVPPPSNLGASPVVLSAPPVGTPAAISAHAAPAGRIEEPPAFRAKRGKGLWIVLLLLLIAAGAAAFFFLRGARKRADVPVPAAKPEATAPIAEAPPPAETEPTTAQSSTAAAEPTASAEPASTDAGASPEPTSPEPAAETPVAPNPPSGVTEPTGSAQAGGGFADLFAAGAKQASVGRFDPKIARASVDRLLSDAARCREPGGPTGYVRVDVTFQPAGTVSNAVVTDAPISGTSTAACISAVFKRATIPEFSGTAGTVTTRISIQ